jgi:hypothetical protein
LDSSLLNLLILIYTPKKISIEKEKKSSLVIDLNVNLYFEQIWFDIATLNEKMQCQKRRNCTQFEHFLWDHKETREAGFFFSDLPNVYEKQSFIRLFISKASKQ